jgi:guanylate kinase
MHSGNLYVIAGPSGVGKGTVVRRLLAEKKNLRLSISLTTREPRQGEKDGEHYFFVSESEFNRNIASNNMLEYESFFNHQYGTPKDFVIENLSKGFDVVLEIDVKGALRVKKNYPAAVLIFLEPPTIEELTLRIRGRGGESEEGIAMRIERAKMEIAEKDRFDYVIMNDDLNIATAKVLEVMEE